MTRRTLLSRGAAAAALSVLPAACSRTDDLPQLNVFIWADYLPDAVAADLAKELNCRVQVDTFTSNEEMIARVGAGKSGFDIVCPSPYAVTDMARLNLLEKLDPAALPNLTHLDERFRRPAGADSDYAVPYLGGSTGIAWNRKKLPFTPTKWMDLFDPAKLSQIKGRLSVLDDARETTAIALLALGFSPNTSNPDELAKAAALLKAQKPFLASYDSETFEDTLLAGTMDLVHGYSGDLVSALEENEDLAFLLPEEGALFNVDCLCLLKESEKKELALKFMNAVHRPEIMARVVSETGYISVNAAARELTDEKPRSSPCRQLPPPEKMFVLESPSQEVKDAYDRLWQEVKQA